MSDNRKVIEMTLHAIESMPLDELRKHPQLERLIPHLYEALQIEDVCDHKFIDGVCICGAKHPYLWCERL